MALLNFTVAMFHLNFSAGVCFGVSNERSWSLGAAVSNGDEVPCPRTQGSAFFFIIKNEFFLLLKMDVACRSKTTL